MLAESLGAKHAGREKTSPTQASLIPTYSITPLSIQLPLIRLNSLPPFHIIKIPQ